MTHGSLEDRRQGLLRWIAAAGPQGSRRNRVTVVFDGNEAYAGGDGAQADVRVVFSRGQTADDCIKAIVERARDPKGFVVVSDDKDIKLYVRALGAKVSSVKEFAADLFKRPAKGIKASAAAESGRKISLVQADKINKELEKIWLK